MEKLIMCVLILLMNLLTKVLRVESAVWQQAHATFYGGSDASGTMGNLQLLVSMPNFIFIILCSSWP